MPDAKFKCGILKSTSSSAKAITERVERVCEQLTPYTIQLENSAIEWWRGLAAFLAAVAAWRGEHGEDSRRAQ